MLWQAWFAYMLSTLRNTHQQRAVSFHNVIRRGPSLSCISLVVIRVARHSCRRPPTHTQKGQVDSHTPIETHTHTLCQAKPNTGTCSGADSGGRNTREKDSDQDQWVQTDMMPSSVWLSRGLSIITVGVRKTKQ